MNGETLYTGTLGDLLTLITILLCVPAVLLQPRKIRPLFSPLSPALLPEIRPSASAWRSQAEGSGLLPAGAFFGLRLQLFSALAEPPPSFTLRPT